MSKAKSIRTSEQMEKAAKRKAWWDSYTAGLKYAFHVISRPFDGFWDLAHEHKGNLAAANTFLFLFLLNRILTLLCTNFQFISAPIQHINIFEEAASLLIPFLVLCVANWAMTTLFDGKGRFKDIYMAMCYALLPIVLIQMPLILISNMLSFEEGSFYSVLMGISIVWTAFLIFVGLMQIHDYSPGKSFIFLFVTLFGACVIIFLALVFFSLLSDAIGYFISIYREIAYRLY